MMNELILTGIISTVTASIGAWVSWFFTRKKYNTEVAGNQIENMLKSLEFYKEVSESNQRILDLYETKLTELKAKNEELEEEIRELRKQMFSLMESVCVNLTCKIRERETKKVSIKPLKITLKKSN